MAIQNKIDKIFIAGHNGMVGSALVRVFKNNGYQNLILKSHNELDLIDFNATKKFFKKEQPDIIILAAARAGGILANIERPAEFLYENLAVQNNVIHLANIFKVKKFIFLGSSCIYPRECPQPIKEEYLFTGPLEPTNEGYALAKIAGLKMVEFYNKQYGFPGFSLMPCNLYGTGDHFDLHSSHVLSSLVRKFIEAKENNSSVTIWGTGIARREFMHVDDFAEAVLFLFNNYHERGFINVGVGEDISIKELANLIADLVEYKNANIIWDREKPDGMLRKCLDISKLNKLGFNHKISLAEGIKKTINEFIILKKQNKIL